MSGTTATRKPRPVKLKPVAEVTEAALHKPLSAFELKDGEEPWDWSKPIAPAAGWDDAAAAYDTAWRNARVEIHGDVERVHGPITKGMTPCWERPEWAGLGDTGPQPQVPGQAVAGFVAKARRLAVTVAAKVAPSPAAEVVQTIPVADVQGATTLGSPDEEMERHFANFEAAHNEDPAGSAEPEKGHSPEPDPTADPAEQDGEQHEPALDRIPDLRPDVAIVAGSVTIPDPKPSDEDGVES